MSAATHAIEIVALPSAVDRKRRTWAPDRLQPELDLQFLLPSGVPAIPRPKLRLVRSTGPDTGNASSTPGSAADAASDADDLADFAGWHATPTSQLPDPATWSARLTQAIIEVRAGLRPHHQLSRWTSHAVMTELRSSIPNNPSRPAARERVTSVHIGQPLDGVVEACAIVVGASRSVAVAIRLEGWDGRWICTSADVIS